MSGRDGTALRRADAPRGERRRLRGPRARGRARLAGAPRDPRTGPPCARVRLLLPRPRLPRVQGEDSRLPSHRRGERPLDGRRRLHPGGDEALLRPRPEPASHRRDWPPRDRRLRGHDVLPRRGERAGDPEQRVPRRAHRRRRLDGLAPPGAAGRRRAPPSRMPRPSRCGPAPHSSGRAASPSAPASSKATSSPEARSSPSRRSSARSSPSSGRRPSSRRRASA